MPNIPVYNAPEPDIRIPNTATESWGQAARTIGQLGREAASQTKQSYEAAAKGLNEFGEKLQQNQDYNDKLKGINGLSELERRHEDQIQALKNDPNITPDQLPGRLAEAYKGHLAEIDGFQSKFANSSKPTQIWAAEKGFEYRKHLQMKFESDSANSSGVAAAEGVKKNLNDIATGLGNNPSPLDLDRGIKRLDDTRDALLANPGLTFEQRGKIRETFDAQRQELSHAVVKGMLDKDPSRWPELKQRYGTNLRPEQQTSLEEHAATVQRRKSTEDAQVIGNAIADEWAGRRPAGSVIPNQNQAPTSSVKPGPTSADDPRGMIPVIRAAAIENNVDPDYAVRATQKEGLFVFDGDNKTSFTAFHLHRGGGMGDHYEEETGKDLSDPRNEVDAINWTMRNLRRFGGWEPFNGTHGEFGTWDGIGEAPRQNTNIAASPPRTPSPIAQIRDVKNPPGIVDRSEDAGFGDRFGHLQPVKGMIIHHTAGGSDVDSVISTFQQTGYPAQYVIDREGKIYQTLPDGARGQHIRAGWGEKGEGLSNANTLGVEIIAKDDSDVTPVQRQAAAKLVGYASAKYGFDPRTAVFGHGEVNPGHKQDTEGMSVVNGIRSGELDVGGTGPSGGKGAPAGAGGDTAGLLEKGNIDLSKRPVVKNKDGSVSTVRSMSINEDGKEVLIPTVAADGSRVLSDKEAIDQYHDSGKFLGKFDTPENATAYGKQLHEAQAQQYAPETPKPGPLRAFPSREQLLQQMLGRMPKNYTLEQQATFRQEAERIAEASHKKIMQESEEERASLLNEMNGGLEKLKNGLGYDYNENTIRHYFEPKIAEKFIANLNDAKQIGQQIGKIRETPVKDIFETMGFLQESLAKTDPSVFTEHHKMVEAYLHAGKSFLEGIGMWPGQANGDRVDPAQYLNNYDPNLRSKFIADLSKPENAQAYANATLQRQSNLGLPPERQRVLTNPMAQSTVQSIVSDPEHAGDRIQLLRQQWGGAFDHVWSDLVTHGRLPAGYQLMEAMDDPRDKWMLARGLTEQDTASAKAPPGEAAARKESFWEGYVGTKQYHQVRDVIRSDPTVRKFMVSMFNSKASGSQANSLMGAIDTLAYSKMVFDPSINGDPTEAANAAVKSALGHYEFMGTARIPTSVFDNVSTNAAAVVRNLNLDNVSVPKGFGGVGEPTADSYVSAQVKANPSWMTTPKEDAIQLIDSAGRAVLDKVGNPITVKFGDVKAKPTPQPTPAMSPYTGPF